MKLLGQFRSQTHTHTAISNFPFNQIRIISYFTFPYSQHAICRHLCIHEFVCLKSRKNPINNYFLITTKTFASIECNCRLALRSAARYPLTLRRWYDSRATLIDRNLDYRMQAPGPVVIKYVNNKSKSTSNKRYNAGVNTAFIEKIHRIDSTNGGRVCE